MMEKIIKELLKAIKSSDTKKTNPYDTSATVTRVENGVAYVHIPGGVDETPVKLTVNVRPGDEVQIRVGGGQAWITGNETAPPTDDRVANEVASNLSITNRIVKTVKAIAETAATIAGNTAQYFWHTETGTDTGAHVTEIPQADFEADPTHGGGNLLLRSNGIAVRDGLTELATFAAGLIQMGESGGWMTKVTDTGFQIWDETTPSNPKLKMFLDASGLDFYEEVSGVNLSVAEITPLTGGGLAIKNLISHQEFRMNSAGAEIMNQYGHGMSLSGGDLSVTGKVTSHSTPLIYVPDDTLTIANWPTSGYVTSGGQDVLFYFCADKILSGVTGFNISSLTVNLRHVGGGYVGGSDYNALNDVNAKYIRGNHIYIRLRKTAGYGITNNTPVCGEIANATIAFT